MTIYDLKWEPARIGTGFLATCKFDDGITAYLRSEDGESYRMTIDNRADGFKTHNALNRERANGLLTFYAMAHSI